MEYVNLNILLFFLVLLACLCAGQEKYFDDILSPITYMDFDPVKIYDKFKTSKTPLLQAVLLEKKAETVAPLMMF